MERSFSGTGHAQPVALVVGKAAEPIPSATPKHMRNLLRDAVEKKNFILVPDSLSMNSRIEQMLVPIITAKKAKRRRPELKKHDAGDHEEGAEYFDGKQSAELTSCTKQQELFHRNVLSK